MKFPLNKLVLIFISFFFLNACKDDDSGDSVNDPKAENRKGLGTSAADLLSDDIYKKLTVEFVYANGFRPTEETITNFRVFLNERLNKSEAITIIETVINAPQGMPFTIEEIREIEDEHRTIYTVEDEIAVFVFFANGNSENDTDTSVTLGTAYQNTSIVVYEKTLMDLVNSNPTADLTVLETNTLNHEFGHILGLVNIQDDDIHTEHEDTGNSRHCFVEDCLMYFESNNTARTLELMGRQAAPQLDELCIADLQVKGGK